MNDDQEQKPKFKVEDRRRFSETGESREGVEDDAATAAPVAPSAAESRAAAAEADHEASKRPGAAQVAISFSSFVLSLSTQALAHLGEIPNLLEGQIGKDLGAAKQLIDILGILQEKTKGNLDSAEAGLLTHALYDLRLKYVEHARQSS